MRWNVRRPSLTVATMPTRPGSVSTMPAADLATSVAVDTAMRICACRSAGASLAPSPHMPTVWPPCWNALTSLYLSSGRTPANTANVSGCTASGIGPGGQAAPYRPTACATMAAVAGASPVTITVRTPNPCSSVTRTADSARGESLSAMSPASFIAVGGPAATMVKAPFTIRCIAPVASVAVASDRTGARCPSARQCCRAPRPAHSARRPGQHSRWRKLPQWRGIQVRRRAQRWEWSGTDHRRTIPRNRPRTRLACLRT